MTIDSPANFYLGAKLGSDGERGDPVHYEAADLTTHGVIVGMTGSGKTGLGVCLLEEALLDGIPCLVIDPKGDMTNLLLNFPDLLPASFEPWVDEGVARRERLTTDDLAARIAGEWRDGLVSWQVSPERMQQLKDATRFTIYTPGSTAGVPLNVLGSLEAPPGADTESIRDEIENYVSSLLVLAGINSDPISGPEHILLANIIETAWVAGQNLDLAALIGQVQKPPFRRLGVFELDAFFPPKDRNALAMRLNGLVASPSFAAWREGVALDIQKLVFDGERVSAPIFYLAHLSEPERQFFVTLLLSKLVTHMRSQQGSSDLRVLLYMDEIAGFCPPTAEPPSKKPILTLFKQARAFGYGLVLATQNPMDFDYKIMSNAGTWLIGRLQTERDKARILEALQSASGGVDVAALDRRISALGKRQFVLHTTRGNEPELITSRWAMSYLAGPLSKQQVAELSGDATTPLEVPSPVAPPSGETLAVAPLNAMGVSTTYLDNAATWAGQVGADHSSTRLVPMVAATVNLLYDEAASGTQHSETYEAVLTDPGAVLTSENVIPVDHDPRDFVPDQPANSAYVPPMVALDKASTWKKFEGDLVGYLVARRSIRIWKNPGFKIYSRVGELESDFRSRVIGAAEQATADAIAALKQKFDTRIDRVKDHVATAQRKAADLEGDVSARRQQEVMSGAGDLLGALLGGRRSATITKAANRRSQTKRTEARRDSAAEAVADKLADLEAVEQDLAEEIETIRIEMDDKAAMIEEVSIPLEKVDVKVTELKLVWVPIP
ncbi:MAG: helicase HerA domain-containing protein [Acidimicrobiia bacterium]